MTHRLKDLGNKPCCCVQVVAAVVAGGLLAYNYSWSRERPTDVHKTMLPCASSKSICGMGSTRTTTHGVESALLMSKNVVLPKLQPRYFLGSAVPPNSVSQAGAACVCRSQAWDAKIVTSAWWVHAHQVHPTSCLHVMCHAASSLQGTLHKLASLPFCWIGSGLPL